MAHHRSFPPDPDPVPPPPPLSKTEVAVLVLIALVVTAAVAVNVEPVVDGLVRLLTPLYHMTDGFYTHR